MTIARAKRVRGLLVGSLLVSACQSSSDGAPSVSPHVTLVPGMGDLGIAVYRPDVRTVSLFVVGAEGRVDTCQRWRLEGAELTPIPEPCAATAPPSVRKTVP